MKDVKKEMPIPRIRGKVGQCYESDDPKLVGKWFFNLYLTTLGGGEGMDLGQFGPWDTEEIAQKELMVAARVACESIEEKLTGEVSGEYIDMKDNRRKPWSEEPVRGKL